MNNTCASGEMSNAPLFTGIGSEEAVNTILTAMVISTSFVAVYNIAVPAYDIKQKYINMILSTHTVSFGKIIFKHGPHVYVYVSRFAEMCFYLLSKAIRD